MGKNQVSLIFSLLACSLFSNRLLLGQPPGNLDVENGSIYTISNGTNNYTSTYVGSNTSSNTLNVVNGATVLSNSSNMYIGNIGANNNSLIVSNGGTVQNTNGYIGFSNSSSNSVLITGAQSTWVNNGGIVIGYSNSSFNLLTISDGATVDVQSLIIGSNVNSSNNSILLAGSNSVLHSASYIEVGASGSSNSLMMSQGASLINLGDSYIGSNTASSNNQVLIRDRDTFWNNGGNFYLGYNGSSNNLTISAGGRLASSNGSIGTMYTSRNNSVLVADLESIWSNRGTLMVGFSGSGTLTVANGGLVVANNGIMVAANSGSSGTINIGAFGGSDRAGDIVGDINFGSGMSTVNFNQINTNNFTNLLSGSNVTLNFLNGTTILRNSNNTYRGSNIINGGILITALAGALGNSNNTLYLENGGILDLGNTTQTQSIVNIDTGIMGNGLLNAQSFNFLGGINSVSASLGNYDAPGSVANVTINSGTTTLSGSSTYSGTTAVHGGLLIAGSSQAVGNSELMLHGGSLKIQTPNLIVPTLNWISTNSQIQLSLGTNTISATNFNIGTTNSNGAYVFNVINSALDNDYHSFIYYDSGNVPASANSFSILGLADGDYSFRIINVSASGFNYALQAIISKTANYVVNGVDTINTHVTFNSITYDPNSTLIMGPSGQLNVTSNYTSSDTGTLEIIVTAAGATASIRVGGTATLGGKLVLDFINGTAFGNTYNIISAENFQGTFENTNIFVLNSGFRARWIDSSTVRYVVIAPSSYTQVAQNSNELQVATALDSFITATSGDAQVVSTALDFLTSEQYPVAFEQIMPTLYQSLSTISFNIANAQNQEMIQRLWGVRIAAAQEEGGNFQMSGFSERMPMFQDKENKEVKKDILSPAPDNHWGMFVDGNGIFAQASANNLSTYNAESGGVTTGFNYRWNKKVSTGLYAGYQGVYSKYSGGSTLVDDQVNFGLFGTYGQEIGKGLFIDALAGGAYDNYQMNRNISFGSGSFALNRTAKGMPGAGELNTMIASGYDFQKGNFTFGPLSSLQYQYFGATPFAESGAQALNLNVSSWDTSSLILSLGSHVAYNWQPTKNLLVIPQISLNWQHQFLENPYTINSTLNSGSSPIFANTSSVPLRDTLFTGIGFTIEFAKHWDTSFFYNASAGNRDLVSQNIFWSLGFNF